MASRSTPSQIPFDLSPIVDLSWDSLCVSDCNADAVAVIRNWQTWPAPVLLLQGPSGTGKTHIGTAWGRSADAIITQGGSFDGLPDGADALFIDDADRADPQAVFAAINQALAGEVSYLLLSATLAPTDWPHSLPDLHSRMKNTAVVSVDDPDDAVLEAVMRKLFEDAGRTVSRDLVQYLIARSERSVPALAELIGALDAQARIQKADLTKAFAARTLSQHPDLFEGS